MTPARLATVALAATLAIQTFTSVAAAAAAVLAPAIAAEFGIEPNWVGVYVGLMYAGATTASLASGGFIERYGAIRVSQACVVISAAGVVLMALTPVALPLLLAVAALVIGIGYGPITPASSQLLARTTPPGRMGVTFSIKQTGVPAGFALAGAALPTAAALAGWRGAFGIVAVLGLAIAFASEPIRAPLDIDRQHARRLSLRGVLAPLAYLRDRALRQLATNALAYSAAQVCLTSFLVVYLAETLRYPLVTAGFALSAATTAGVVGRIGWGYVADRWLAARPTLALIGALSAVCGVLLAAFDPAWPTFACLALATAYGVTAIGWNGVQLAEIARLAPRGAAAAVTGATSFVTFSGVVIGPPVFAAVASVTGSYRVGFAAIAALTAVCAGWLLWSWRRESRS